jgi:integrase/recombinase XerC
MCPYSNPLNTLKTSSGRKAQMSIFQGPPPTSKLKTLKTYPVEVAGIEAPRVVALIQLWLSGRAETTSRAYRQDLSSWADWMGSPPAAALAGLLRMEPGEANAMGMAYRASMKEEGLSPATINRRLAALRSIVDAARTVGIISWPLSVSGVKAQAYRDTRGPGVGGYRAMVKGLEEDTPQNLRDRALLALLYSMALRRAEVVALDLGDVDLDGSRLWIVGKGRTQKEAVTMPPQTAKTLSDWIEARGQEPGPLFVSMDRRLAGSLSRPTLNAITRRVREIGRDAGVRVSPHGLRHAGITRALDLTGGDARRVRALSRHAKLETLMLYDDARRDAGGEVAALLASDV